MPHDTPHDVATLQQHCLLTCRNRRSLPDMLDHSDCPWQLRRPSAGRESRRLGTGRACGDVSAAATHVAPAEAAAAEAAAVAAAAAACVEAHAATPVPGTHSASFTLTACPPYSGRSTRSPVATPAVHQRRCSKCSCEAPRAHQAAAARRPCLAGRVRWQLRGPRQSGEQ